MDDQERRPVTSLREYLSNAKEAVDIFRWVWREATTPQSRRKLYIMFAGLGINIITCTIQPGAIGIIFAGLVSKSKDMVIWGLVLNVACLLGERVTMYFKDVAREWVIGFNWGKLDERITELFFEKSIGQHIHEGSTLSVSNIDKGRWRLLDMQNMLLFEGVAAIAQLIVAFIFLCFLAWFAGLIMGIVIAIYVVWSLYLNLRLNQVCTPIDKDLRAINRHRVERWERVERVKISGKEIDETTELSSRFDQVITKDRQFWIWYITHCTFRGLFNDAGVTIIIIVGAYLVWNGNWQLGTLYPLLSWTGRVAENIWRLGSIEHQINWNLPSVKSMIKALQIPPAIVDASDAIPIDPTHPHHVEFMNVSHNYPAEKDGKDTPPALVKVSFSILPGEKVALLGRSGSGKSTAMRKLLRFDDPTSGYVAVDGIDLRRIVQSDWRRGIGYVPQQSQVLDGSIRYNLTYRLNREEKAAMTDEILWDLMRRLQIDFKERLTNGLDTLVGKNGIKLSGGQAQRLMIGAAVIKRPWLLIVDEATSSLDSLTEHDVQQGLSEVLSGNETSALIVAHRLSTVRHLCSKFVVLKSANEVVNGDSQVEAVASSFEELYGLSPTFRRLADYQGVVISQPK